MSALQSSAHDDANGSFQEQRTSRQNAAKGGKEPKVSNAAVSMNVGKPRRHEERL
jgi:hypothetical protein